MKCYARQNGMTLLEILVALTIFILIAGAGYTGLQQAISVEDGLQHQRVFWRRLDSVMLLIQQDLDHARNLGQRIPLNSTRPFAGTGAANPGAGGELMLFTRGGHASYSSDLVSPHLRVAYRLRDGILYRVTWPRLNMPEDEQGNEAELTDRISGLQMRYLDNTHTWHSNWPMGTVIDKQPALPRAVELTLELENGQIYERVFHVGLAY
jgi:general secretion pathway protein J